MTKSYKTVMCHEVCTGCSCCLLSCPVWNRTRDRSLTAQGRNKALQGGATAEDISDAIDSCILCGACEANCPEGNDIVGLTIEQRKMLNITRKDYPSWYPQTFSTPAGNSMVPYNGPTVLAGKVMNSDPELGKTVLRIIGKDATMASDDGIDIVRAMDAGLPVNQERIDAFINPLRSADRIVVVEGGIKRYLREWLPGKKVVGLGEALLSIKPVRRSIGPKDLYVVESRGFHSDYARLVRFYDELRKETGAQFNLDLQRTAIPTGASSIQAEQGLESAGCLEQVKWILHGRSVGRIIVEDPADIEAFRNVTNIPVVHVALI